MSDGCHYFEDFKVGDEFQFIGPAIDLEEIKEYARAYDPQPHHLDEEAAKDSILQGISASGWHNCARLMGLCVESFMNNSAHVGFPDVDEVRWRSPVRPGDEFHVTRTIKSAEPIDASNGKVAMHFRVTSQDGRELMLMDMTCVYERAQT